MFPINLIDPYMTIAINKPKTKDELKRMFLALKMYAEEDTSFFVYTNDTSKQTIIAGKGEQHLNRIVDRLISEFNIEIDVEKPQVLYKETIRKTVRSEGRYIKQASSLDRYGHCWIELEPNIRGTGYEFINKITDENIIPNEYIEPVNEGIQQAITRGVLGNYPVVDVKVTLFNGSFNQIDSSQMAFKIAGYLALREGLKQSDPVILEPIMRLTVETLESNILAIMDEIHLIRGRNEEIKSKNNICMLIVDVPLSELIDFTKSTNFKIRAESFSMEFGYYNEVPDCMKESIIHKSSLQDADYTDLFFWGKWGKESEERYLNDFIESFWK